MAEQQVVLEHDADRAPSPGRRRGGGSSRTRRRGERPRSMGRSPATQRSSVDLPAPFGPRMATSSPGSTASSTSSRTRATGRRGACRLMPSTAAEPAEPAVAQRDEHGERDGDEHEAQHERRLGRSRGRGRWRGAWSGCVREVAGERDRRPELAEGSRPRQHGAGHEAGADRRQRHAPEHVPARCAEGARRVLEAGVELAECGLHGEHEERHGDERLGDDHARVVNGMTPNHGRGTGRPARGGRGRRTARRRRPRAAAPSTACTAPARRRGQGTRLARAARRAARRRRRRAPPPQRVQIDRRSAWRPRRCAGCASVAPRHPPEQPDERQGEERDRRARREPGKGRQACALSASGGGRCGHGAPKP